MKCTLCDENFDTNYRIPRNLNCGHCFCDQCLKIYEKSEEIECAKCNKKSPSQLPICYAILELIEAEDHDNKNLFCETHPMETIEFYCKDDHKYICVNCAITIHRDHNFSSTKANSIGQEIKYEFTKNSESLKHKLDKLKKIKRDLEKIEDFLEVIRENQISKLNKIYSDIISKKNENLEELNEFVEKTYSNQVMKISELIKEDESRKEILEIYCDKIQEQLNLFKLQNVSEIANFNMIKTEDEFRKLKIGLEECQKNPEHVILTSLKLEIDPGKLLKQESLELNIMNEENSLLTNKKSLCNHILFFGDSRDKLVLQYSIHENKWSRLIYNLNDEFEFLDYSAASAIYNGFIIITGGCNYSNYRNTASRQTLLVKTNQDKSLTISPFKPMLIHRFSHGCLTIKDIPYVFGGHNGNETLSSMEYYDKNEEKWKFLSSMNIDREIFGYCSVKNRYIYVFGGFNTNNMDTIERYDVIYDKWKLLSYKMKRPLQNVTTLALDKNNIALIGGYSGAYHKCIDVLNLENKNWISFEYLRVPRRRSHVYKNNDKLYIFGGEGSESEEHIPEALNLDTKRWESLQTYGDFVWKSLTFWSSAQLN